MKFSNFEQAQEFLYSRIPTQMKVKHQAGFGLERTVEFLKLLGGPQNKIKVIHVAGTSGKGSTSYLISHLLHYLGLKTALHISPHLLDIRERAQINNKLLSKEQFVQYLNQILPAINQMEDTKWGIPTYFEITTALAFYIAYQEKVDYLVSETGVGGLYDATNAVDNPNKVAVLTKIGLDHTQILGKTISEIALQKAEIIHKNNLVISIWQNASARKVIEKITAKRNAQLVYIKKGTNFQVLQTTAQTTSLALHLEGVRLDNLGLSMLGEYQAENCAVALATVVEICKRDNFEFPHSMWEASVRQALKNAHFAGRFDLQNIKGKQVLLDGAHNPQKMRSFINAVKKVFPDQKFNFLIAFKKGKDYQEMLKILQPISKQVIVTRFFTPNQDWVSLSQEPQTIVENLQKLGFKQISLEENNHTAFKQALTLEGNLIVTGSLYLLADIYQNQKLR